MKKSGQTRFFLFLNFFLFLSPSFIFGNITLPGLISDNMVLQRGTKVDIWGNADKGENVTVFFNNTTKSTITDDLGHWQVTLNNLKAGGPYKMVISGKDTVELNNILIGDVWVCSGQSNMELPMRRVSWVYPDEIANCENNRIRMFKVPQRYNFNTLETDLPGGSWKPVNTENILGFSAVAYFFAKSIYSKYHVPVGIINASLGGSPAEAWISEKALKKFPEYYNEAQKFKDSTLIEKIESADNIRMHAWYDELNKKDRGYSNSSMSWKNPLLNTSEWDTMSIPRYWTNTPLEGINGVAWFNKEIEIPDSLAGKAAKLILGRIVDADSVFINGTFTGTVGYQYPPRRYNIPEGLLKPGKNVIVVRLISNIGTAGFVPDKDYELDIGKQKINLKGTWKYRLGAKMEPLQGQTFIRWKPTGLYNAMIHPILNYTIKGVVWYQGESNAERPIEYRTLFQTLINDWRKDWDQGDFPFIYVQLPNFMETKPEPGESNWALLREAQLKSLALPNTAMAVAIDLGEWNDIHPLHKKDVGERLALAAEKTAYGDNDVICSGPVYQSMKIDKNKIILYFSDNGSKLVCNGGGELKYFAVAGADKKFAWAKAKIKGNKIIVWSDAVKNPVAVRYAWADNPQGANLYNSAGLPASPFRTDNW